MKDDIIDGSCEADEDMQSAEHDSTAKQLNVSQLAVQKKARRNPKEPYINSANPNDLLKIKRVQDFIEYMSEGIFWKDAAKNAGIRSKRAKQILSHRKIRLLINSQVEVVSERERSRNIHTLIHIREKAMKDSSSAAQDRNAMAAIRQLEGSDGINVTINAQQNNYLVDLSEDDDTEQAITNRIETSDKPLKTIDGICEVIENTRSVIQTTDEMDLQQ